MCIRDSLWFEMWLTKQDLGIDNIFAEDVIYTESWEMCIRDRNTGTVLSAGQELFRERL